MSSKVVVNLATGMEDAERVMIAFLVAGAAVAKGKPTAMFLTKDAVHLAVPGQAEGVACDGCPPIERLFEQYAEGGGELLVPDLRHLAGPRRHRARAHRPHRRRHPAVGMDRRRSRDRLQLLNGWE